MLRVVIVRHAETDWNAEYRIQGHSDIPLNELGREQIRLVAQQLASEEFDAIYSSDLKRTMETANAIAAQLNLPVRQDQRLREYFYGDWEGHTWDEIVEGWPAEAAARTKDYTIPPPGGEAPEEFSARVGALLADIRAKHEEGAVVIVTHGGTSSMLACLTIGIGPEYRRSFRLHNTGIAEIVFLPWRNSILRWNDTRHLDGQLNPGV